VTELAATIDRARPALHIEGSSRDRAGQLPAACPGVPCLTLDEADPGIAELRGAPRPDEGCAEPMSSDTAALMFTSGTTSQPKGVVVTQANYAFAGAAMAAAAALHAEDRFFVCLPMFHANAQYYCFAAAIHAGASIALVSRFSASRFMHQAERAGATHASLFAAPIRMILQRTEDPRTSGYALRHVWFAQNLSTGDYERAARLFGCRPRQLYGMTETIAAVLTSHPLEAAGDVIGAVTLGCSVYVGDEATGQPVPTSQVGEIHVGGRPGVELFGGYLDDPGATKRSFRDGWFRTGDLAWVDKDGRFHFAGRSGDRIKVGGENVSLLSIETVIAEHPSVAEVAVVGGPDPVLDEVPIAFVVLKPGHKDESLQPSMADWCGERLSPSRRPRKITYVSELPHTSVGKIRKHMLKRLYASQR
jgi:crotonobetaine/carnitine-CoA ligase